MKFKYILCLTMITILLSACGNEESQKGSISDGESTSENNALDHGAKDQNQDQSDVGFEMVGTNIEEAQNIPANEKKALLETFETYITAFNEEDIEKYMSVIATEPEGFDYVQEEVNVKDVFDQYKINRMAEKVTVIKYTKNQAQVFARLSISLEQESTGAKVDRTGRQVTVFAKEDGNWRVTSVYFIGDLAQ
ncbi:nuclear transport factor 2 family protein [Paenisporosarcina sp. TG20]|uniref:nuclear transport factor 2 family protein n=1 Tax=Paenisporosarcina sp. TG20 TaxID=1211706 RepID=UPI0003023999|nr:nuclear transport factor 2 family protein [Paenisporosarcina sp. TG20]